MKRSIAQQPSRPSISSFLINQVSERLARHIASPVVEEQIQRSRPELTRRHRRYVRSEHNRPKLPQGTCRRQWFLAEHIEHRTPQPPRYKTRHQRILVNESAARHVNDDCRAIEQIE